VNVQPAGLSSKPARENFTPGSRIIEPDFWKVKNKWLTRFNEFTGAEWPAFLNDISRLSYTPLIGAVNRQFSECLQTARAQPK